MLEMAAMMAQLRAHLVLEEITSRKLAIFVNVVQGYDAAVEFNDLRPCCHHG